MSLWDNYNPLCFACSGRYGKHLFYCKELIPNRRKYIGLRVRCGQRKMNLKKGKSSATGFPVRIICIGFKAPFRIRGSGRFLFAEIGDMRCKILYILQFPPSLSLSVTPSFVIRLYTFPKITDHQRRFMHDSTVLQFVNPPIPLLSALMFDCKIVGT